MKQYKPIALFSALILFLLTSCRAKNALNLSPVATKLPSVVPTILETAIPTVTATQKSTLMPFVTITPSVPPTETQRPDVAPILPHTDVHFIYNGDRDKPYVALTFDLCQKPEL